MYKTHSKIWSCFLVPRLIKNTVNSYSCIRCTPSFNVQFWGKKVRHIHETVRYMVLGTSYCSCLEHCFLLCIADTCTTVWSLWTNCCRFASNLSWCSMDATCRRRKQLKCKEESKWEKFCCWNLLGGLTNKRTCISPGSIKQGYWSHKHLSIRSLGVIFLGEERTTRRKRLNCYVRAGERRRGSVSQWASTSRQPWLWNWCR